MLDNAEHIDLTPEPRILEALKSSDISNLSILGELLDNSFDWGSTRIAVSFDNGELTVEDNGAGCIDMQKLLTLGAFQGIGRTGRFGVGLKQSSYSLGDDLYIESAQGGKLVTYHVHWPTFTWIMPRPRLVDYDGPSFMRLRIGTTDSKRLSRMQLKDVQDKLRLMYYPALKARHTIILGGISLQPVEFPILDSKLQQSGVFEGGRYKLTAGLFSNTQKTWHYGFNIAFRDRLMVIGMKDVYGDYDPQGFFAYLELIEDATSHWKLNLNKNGALNQEGLVESLFPVIEPLLQQAQKRYEDVHDRDLISKIEAELNAMMGGRPRKERRNPPAHHGTRPNGNGKGSPRQQASQTQTGNGSVSEDCNPGDNGRCTGYRISFSHEGPEIASVDLGQKLTFVRFYPEHQAVSQWRRTQDHRELLVHAYSLILAKQRMPGAGQQLHLNLSGEDPFQDYVEKLSASAARAYQKAS